MTFEADLIVWLQSFSSPVLDYVVYAITMFGDRIFFILSLTIIYWCVDKNFGFEFFNIYLLGASLNEGIKIVFKRARPYVKYGDRINSIIKNSDGYSFPSGHSQSVANIATQSVIYSKRKKGFIATISIFSCLIFAVMLSRMYLGQHYLTDVIVGACLGVAFVLISKMIYKYVSAFKYKFYWVVLPASIIISVIFLCLGNEKFSDVIKVCGAYAGFTLGFSLENKIVGYKVETDKKFKLVLRFLLGIFIAIVLKILFDFLNSLVDIVRLNDLISYLSYFAVTIWISFVAPYIFSEIHI